MPNTKDWKAWQNLQPGPGGPRLIVIGEVETSNTNQNPSLSEHIPPGINPKILLLDLDISVSGQGNAVMGWQKVQFEKSIEKDQYSTVEILWEGRPIETIEVETVQ